MKESISQIFSNAASLKSKIASDETFLKSVEDAATILREVSNSGGVIYSCGNGGSACDAMHLTEELVARFKRERPGIKAMHFLDSSTLSCWSNDYSYQDVFKRYAETFCSPRDVLIVISTSGNSKNVILAAQAAKERGTKIIGLLGKGGGQLLPLCDVSVVVPSDSTERIQEVHISIIHAFCELLEQ
jgi:D-sedoheptulose 7-phosphate isomerase